MLCKNDFVSTVYDHAPNLVLRMVYAMIPSLSEIWRRLRSHSCPFLYTQTVAVRACLITPLLQAFISYNLSVDGSGIASSINPKGHALPYVRLLRVSTVAVRRQVYYVHNVALFSTAEKNNSCLCVRYIATCYDEHVSVRMSKSFTDAFFSLSFLIFQ